ncbi:hypothetical protein RB595_006483 [Gaeumannomyces hyphopodioides]
MASLVDETISSRSFRVRQLFRDLIDRLKLEKATSVDAETVKEDYARKVVDALDRFNLWAGNIGALLAPTSRLSLDQRLADAPDTREEICQELKELAEAIEDLTEAIHKQCLTNVLDDRAALILVENDPNDDNKSEGEPGKKLGEEPDEKPFDEVCSLLDVISVYLEFLFRLAMLVRKAGPRDRFKHALQASETTFPDDFDINYLREKYPKLRQPEFGWILKRLGGANAKRRQFMKYCRDHNRRLSAEPSREAAATEERVVPTPTELLSSKATTFAPQALAATVALQTSDAVDDEPDEDIVSQLSASTTTNALSALRLPSLEDLSPDGKPIECPICHTIQKFRHDRAWRAHAFRDLKAYVCIAGLDCNEIFGDRNTWFEHELHYHRAIHTCNLCIGGERLSSVSEMQDHFRSCHGQFSEVQAQMLIESGREPVTEFKASDCPFCDEWADRLGAKLDPRGKDATGKAPAGDATVTASRFRRHLAAHQEQLAIFAMPSAVGDDGNDDKDGDEDTTSSRAVAPTTVLDSVEVEGIQHSLAILTLQDGAQVMETDEPAKATSKAPALGVDRIESEHDRQKVRRTSLNSAITTELPTSACAQMPLKGRMIFTVWYCVSLNHFCYRLLGFLQNAIINKSEFSVNVGMDH